MKSIAASFCFAVLATTSCPRAGYAGSDQNAAATSWYSDQFVIHSKFVGRNFLIQAGRPHVTVSGKTPAIYLLDGDTRFGMVAEMEGEFADNGETAPSFVIGISYPEQTVTAWRKLRERDCLHVPRSKTPPLPVGYGEGAKFQELS